jgi:hypothetical protein
LTITGVAPTAGDVCGDLLDIDIEHLACFRLHVYRAARIKPNFALRDQRHTL